VKKIVAWILLLVMLNMLNVVLNVAPVTADPNIIGVPQDYQTIQGAIDAASAGDTIVVSDGTYGEGQINVTKSLVLQANGTVIVDGLRKGHVFYVTANYTTIEGFTVTNSSLQYKHSGIHLYWGQNCTFTNNTMVDNSRGIELNYSDTNIIERNNILNTTYGGWGGASLTESDGNLLSGNRLENHPNHGFDIDYSHNNTIVGVLRYKPFPVIPMA
jgi:parallel beta-helix repeat protein